VYELTNLVFALEIYFQLLVSFSCVLYRANTSHNRKLRIGSLNAILMFFRRRGNNITMVINETVCRNADRVLLLSSECSDGLL
jgi:hypothetical protein